MADEKKSARQMQIDERKDEMAKRRPQARRVRVTPANDEMRRALKHPSGNLALTFGLVELSMAAVGLLAVFTSLRIGAVHNEFTRV